MCQDERRRRERQPLRLGKGTMKRTFTASVCKEGEWYVAQALEMDVASQGTSVDEALSDPREALELPFEPSVPNHAPKICRIDAELTAR